MINFFMRILLSAVVLTFVVPHIIGAHLMGAFWPDAVIDGVLLAFVAYLFDDLISALIVRLLGPGLFFILMGYWLVPVIELKAFAHVFPHVLAFQGWMGA